MIKKGKTAQEVVNLLQLYINKYNLGDKPISIDIKFESADVICDVLSDRDGITIYNY